MASLYTIDFAEIPLDVVELCRRLRAAGHEAYLVGGGVRDLVLRRSVHDWDVATSARPEEVQGIFERSVPTGIKHGTVTVLLAGGRGVEVTTYRGEAGYSDGRHPDTVSFVRSIEEDLSRRDFTVNAMALDPVARVLVDPHEGGEDLARRVLRAVGDPVARFREDSLRVMRAVRFAATLELELETATFAAIPATLGGLRRVSSERIRDELLKLLEAPRPSLGIELMRTSGLLAEVLPELAATIGVTQNRFHSDDVYWHSLRACDAAAPGDPVLRLAVLLHDIGKPETATPHAEREGENAFLRHEEASARGCEAIALRLRLSSADRERTVQLVANHMFPLEGWSSPGLRRFLRRVGEDRLDELFALRAADLSVRPDGEERLRQLAALRERLRVVGAARPPLQASALAIDGKQVMARLAIGPGPRVGEILRALLERVIEEPELNTVERLLELCDGLAVSDEQRPPAHPSAD
jgi:tRNA nucleotidyltransferase/poly(A) polymerase